MNEAREEKRKERGERGWKEKRTGLEETGKEGKRKGGRGKGRGKEGTEEKRGRKKGSTDYEKGEIYLYI